MKALKEYSTIPNGGAPVLAIIVNYKLAGDPVGGARYIALPTDEYGIIPDEMLLANGVRIDGKTVQTIETSDGWVVHVDGVAMTSSENTIHHTHLWLSQPE
jgi:hypothetical protein